MDDLDELTLPRVPLHAAKESSEIRRSEVFCSKIIHQRSNHQIRFRRSPFFLKLVQHSHPEVTELSAKNEYPRPLSSPFPCFQCHRGFKTPPIFIPMEMLDRRVEEWGNFCSGPCANTYLDVNMRDSNLGTRAADLFEYMQDVHGFEGSEIGFAPHFTQHVDYGGDLTDEQFDLIIATPNLTTHILMKPYIPTDAVIEWQYSIALSETGGGRKQQVSNRSELDVGVTQATLKTGEDMLAFVMQSKPPQTDHHHRWDATHLKQPSMEAIEERLASLPALPKTTGLYELYLRRKGGVDGSVSEEENTASADAPATKSRKKQMPSNLPPPPPPMNATTASFANLLTSASSSKKRKKNT